MWSKVKVSHSQECVWVFLISLFFFSPPPNTQEESTENTLKQIDIIQIKRNLLQHNIRFPYNFCKLVLL